MIEIIEFVVAKKTTKIDVMSQKLTSIEYDPYKEATYTTIPDNKMPWYLRLALNIATKSLFNNTC